MVTYKQLATLIVKHRRNARNGPKKKEPGECRSHSEDDPPVFNALNGQPYVTEKLEEACLVNEDWGRIRHMFPPKKAPTVTMLIKYTAIVIALVLATGAVVFCRKHAAINKEALAALMASKPALRGRTAADQHRVQLKLANGHIVYLDSSVNGHIGLQYKSVIYKEGDLLRYEWSTGNGESSVQYNTLTTPAGRKFCLELPDGSFVWMNAGSSITYPTAFSNNERQVQMTGEMYFEVASAYFPDGVKRKPFVVKVLGSGRCAEVQVMGTRFNISAYNAEPVFKTTLVEGQVKIRYAPTPAAHTQWTVLEPGQQAAWKKSGALQIVKDADMSAILAWKSDQFNFRELSINVILQHIARWYDYEVVYKEPVSGHYSLVMPRAAAVTDILHALELAGGVHFTVTGRRIFVYQHTAM